MSSEPGGNNDGLDIRTRIAAKVVGTLAPAMVLVLVISTGAIFLFNPNQWTRYISSATVLTMLLAVWRLISVGRVHLAANLFL